MTWTTDPETAERFLLGCFRDAGIPVSVRREEDGAPRATVRLDAPVGHPITVSARLVGGTLRLVAHQVIQGLLNETVLSNYNTINRAPWWGRLVPTTDSADTDLAIGLPTPPQPDQPFPLTPLLYLLLGSASAVRRGQIPQAAGEPGESAEVIRHRARAWLQREGPVHDKFDGEVLIARRDAHGHPVELELFVWCDTVLAARATPIQQPVDGTPSLFAQLAHYNRGTAAGAAAWREETRLVYGAASFFPALFAVDDRSLTWLVARASDCAAGAMWARDQA